MAAHEHSFVSNHTNDHAKYYIFMLSMLYAICPLCFYRSYLNISKLCGSDRILNIFSLFLSFSQSICSKIEKSSCRPFVFSHKCNFYLDTKIVFFHCCSRGYEVILVTARQPLKELISSPNLILFTIYLISFTISSNTKIHQVGCTTI